MTQAEPKPLYAYHYQDAEHHLIFRYDNAAHKPALHNQCTNTRAWA